jgi:TPR repeat protein
MRLLDRIHGAFFLPAGAHTHLPAARAGNAVAQYRVGQAFYEAGSKAAAAHWYRRAAEAGEDYAQYSLAVMLYEGDGIACDRAEAAQWFERAAGQGDDVSMTWLGAIHRDGADGDGVPADPVAAWMWFELAARCGDAGARTKRDAVGEGLAAAQIADALARADAWEAEVLPEDA